MAVLDFHTLGSVLRIPCEGFSSCQKNKWPDLPSPLKPLEIVRKYSGNPSRLSDSKVYKHSMYDYHKTLFSFVTKNLVPRQEHRDAASYLDLTLMELLDRKMQIDLPGLMILFLIKVATDVKENHALPHRFLLTKVFAKLQVKLPALEYYSGYDALDYYENRVPR